MARGQLNFNFHSDDAVKKFKLFLIYCQSKLPFFLKLHKRAKILNTIVDHLYHNDEDDKEDEVSVEVGVRVPLLLLVETHLVKKCRDTSCEKKSHSSSLSHRHLNAVVQFSNTVADVLLLFCEGIVKKRFNLEDIFHLELWEIFSNL